MGEGLAERLEAAKEQASELEGRLRESELELGRLAERRSRCCCQPRREIRRRDGIWRR